MRRANGFRRQEGHLFRRRLDRASFLRLAGAGAAFSMLPAYLISPRAGAAQAALGTESIAGDEFPIGVWWPPPPAQTSAGRYAEIRDAGFNFVIGGNGVNSDATNPAALDAAAANGLKLLLTDGNPTKAGTVQGIIGGATSATTDARSTSAGEDPSAGIMQTLMIGDDPQRSTLTTAAGDSRQRLRARIQELLASYAAHPALAGLNIYDEPHKRMFGLVGYAKDVMQELAPGELPYANVWPSYASTNALGTSTYKAYLERYFEVVRPPVLCFDHYPLLSDGGITKDYFYNWALIRKYALQFGVPSWGFVQSVGFDGRRAGLPRRRRPNEQELLWQVNVSLAYGAKGLQYFTYWTPNSNSEIQFGQALVSRDGNPTSLYHAAGRVNGYLRVVGRTLLPLVSESVVHAGEKNPPRGAKPFERDAYVRSRSGSPVILSRFRNPAGGTDRHLLVANRSPSRNAVARLKLSASITRVSEIDPATDAPVPATLQGDPPCYLPVSLAPGAARLYLLEIG